MPDRQISPGVPVVEPELDTELRIRVHGNPEGATLIYLPGVHGDWTLVGGFRRAVAKQLRFVEVTYPRTRSWSLADYARGVEKALAEAGICRGWLLGESFGSQIVWEVLRGGHFNADGVVLAGGFGRHPAPWMARAAAFLAGGKSQTVLRACLLAYAQAARIRFRRSPETLAGIKEFIARRTALDFQAIRHRFDLVAKNDPSDVVVNLRVPVYLLTGLFDPIVPWVTARRWLARRCPTIAEHRVLRRADHNVLGTAPVAAADQVLRWLNITSPPADSRSSGGSRAAQPADALCGRAKDADAAPPVPAPAAVPARCAGKKIRADPATPSNPGPGPK